MKLIYIICFFVITQNSFGQFVGTPYLIQNPAVAPDPPTMGKAKWGDAEASIAFIAPTNNGGGAISSYTVTSNPGGITATGTGSPIIITGLTNGTSYTFTVTSTNSAGTSTASTASTSVTPRQIQTITSLTTKVWMDRNLGAEQVATSKTDALAFGDLYQWGRDEDGHQIRTSQKISTPSPTDQPEHGYFIYNSNDWLSLPNNNLWNGVDAVNNPCPCRYRLPTRAEWDKENSKNGVYNDNTAFTKLKLTLAGTRRNTDGAVMNSGEFGIYATSEPYGESTIILQTGPGYSTGASSNPSTKYRAQGLSVRCIKND